MGLSPVIFPCVKLIHKNISSVELEHSTSQGECYFCKNAAKEIYPSTEGARTTYMREEISPEQCKWCADLVLALSRGGISPSVPIPTQRYKARCYQSACPGASPQPSNCYSLLSFSRMQLLRLHYGSRTKSGEKSTGATTCCKSSKDAPVSHAVPFPFLGGASCRLPCFLSLPPSYQNYYNRLIIPFYALDKNINHLNQMF